MDSDKNRQGKVYGERNTLAVGQDVGIWLHRPDDAEQEAEHNKATAGVVQAGGDGEAPMKTTHVAERREQWERENKGGREAERILTLEPKIVRGDTTVVPNSVRRMRGKCVVSGPVAAPGFHKANMRIVIDHAFTPQMSHHQCTNTVNRGH
eukprot:6776723-Prymnesium_polylepis.1